MSELLRPEEVRELLANREQVVKARDGWETSESRDLRRLCRDYLTLWEENRKLRDELAIVDGGWYTDERDIK